jgi:hypothetical protein
MGYLQIRLASAERLWAGLRYLLQPGVRGLPASIAMCFVPSVICTYQPAALTQAIVVHLDPDFRSRNCPLPDALNAQS